MEEKEGKEREKEVNIDIIIIIMNNDRETRQYIVLFKGNFVKGRIRGSRVTI